MNTWLLRIALASVLLFHGVGKVMMGVEGFAGMFELNLIAAYLVTFAELAGGAAILVGGVKDFALGPFTVTQWGALATIPVTVGAIVLVHWANGFSFMTNGWEFQAVLTLIAAHLFLVAQSSTRNK